MLQNSKTQKPAISMLPAVIQHCPQDSVELQQVACWYAWYATYCSSCISHSKSTSLNLFIYSPLSYSIRKVVTQKYIQW